MTAALDDADKRIGARVRAVRVALGLSQTTVGDALNLTYQQIQKYERGTNRLSVGTLQRIADKLGLPASVFLDPEHRDLDEAGSHPGLSALAFQSMRSTIASAVSEQAGPGLTAAEPAGPASERRPTRRRPREDKVRAWQRFR